MTSTAAHTLAAGDRVVRYEHPDDSPLPMLGPADGTITETSPGLVVVQWDDGTEQRLDLDDCAHVWRPIARLTEISKAPDGRSIMLTAWATDATTGRGALVVGPFDATRAKLEGDGFHVWARRIA